MKRTYRSKKDVAGALDHKDILNFNDKSSVFDAFYIQNLKQTKRELSYVSSNQYVVASKNIRKRKYTKRIVKDANVISKDSSPRPAYLTPDKSIRVNKAFDPFDALLNSSVNTHADVKPNKNDLSKNEELKRGHKLYTRQKKKNKPKRINYSSSGTDGEKENLEEISNMSHNETDIRKHSLLIEKDTKTLNNFADESIKNIVFNKHLNNLKQNTANESLSKFSLTRVKLTDDVKSPILQHSPLSSTPFKEKYRSQSIYKFSPIPKSYDNSFNISAIAEKSIHNDSEILIGGYTKSEPKFQKSPITHLSNDNVKLIETSLLPLSDIQGNSSSGAHVFNLDKTENKRNDNLLNNIQTNTCIEVSSLQTTETEAFLGFPNNFDPHFIGAIEGNDKNGIVQNADELHVYETEHLVISQNIIDLADQDINNDQTIMQNSIGEIEANYINNRTHDSIKFSLSDLEEKRNDCKHIKRQTLYDTCNNESLEVVNRSIVKEPIVRLERLKDSIFFKYHKNNSNVSQNDDLTDEDSKDYKSFQNKTTTSNEEDSIESDNETSSTTEASKSSIIENEISSSDEPIKSANEEERCINFVTTRRRTDPINRYALSDFEYMNYNGSIELEQTVCNNLTDNNTGSLNVSKVNSDDMSSHDEVSTLLNLTEKSMSLKQNSNIEKFISTSSNESNYYDNDSTDDTSMYTIASDKRLSIKNYLQCSERKRNTRKRSSRIIRIRKSQSTSEYSDYHDNNRKNEHDLIEVISSDSAPEKLNSVDLLHNRSVLLRKMNEDGLNKAVETNSAKTDNQNEVSLPVVPPNVLDSDDTDSCNSRVNTSSVITKKNKRASSKYTKVYGKFSNVGQANAQTNNNIDTLNSKKETVQATCNIEQKPNECDSINSDVINNVVSKASSVESKILLRKTTLNKIPDTSSIRINDIKPSIVLEPGKKWERSLSIYRRMTVMADNLNQSILDEPMQMKGRKYRQSVISTIELQDSRGSLHNESINNRRSTFISKPNRSTIKFVKDPNITRVSLYSTAVYDDLKGFLSDDCDDTIVDLSKLSIADAEPDVTVLEVQNTSNRLATARDYVLRRCNQTDAILFDECYPDTVLKNCHKIGEGVYGEVFLWRDRDGRARVMKIVPIAGHVKVNGEFQKDFHEIISEVVIAMELSALRAPIADIERHFDEGKSIDALDLHTIENATDVFNEVLAVRCVYGNYPSRLLDLWDLYDECKGSENDNPAILPVDQQYIVLELANAGLDLESYQFNNAEQAHALFLQVAFGLAVGEEAYQFEHRDLHWGNVLISPTDQKFATFVLRGRGHRLPRCGVSATIIDYSLSRISLPLGTPADCAALYNDLAADDGLFDAVGDYQFEVYRLMRNKLGNDWKNFEPHTNILWLHYVVDKMITALRYKRTNTKIHKHYIDKLKSIKNRILDYKSAVEFVLTDNEF